MKEKLRRELEARAERHGISLSAEVTRLIEASLREEEEIGGAGMRKLSHLWAAAFVRGGTAASRAAGREEWDTERWLAEPFAFNVARHSADQALRAVGPVLAVGPGVTAELRRWHDAVQDGYAERLLTGTLTEKTTVAELAGGPPPARAEDEK